MDLANAVKDLSGKKIVILGDLVADQFLRGTISRVSREAPVFILRHDETETLPGGAANTAANVASLGGEAHLVGVTGIDAASQELRAALAAKGVVTERVIADPQYSTPTKIRVLAGQNYAPRQQVIRIDYENASGLTEQNRDLLLTNLRAALEGADGLIISDYGYGTAFPEIVAAAKKICKDQGTVVAVDSRHRLAEFAAGANATPNREELAAIIGDEPTPKLCAELRERLSLDTLLCTNGNRGMALYAGGDESLDLPAVGSTQPVDVTGAGDTVIAAYALALASGIDAASAARIANHAGGIVVMKHNTATVSAAELIDSIRRNEPVTASSAT